MSKVPACWRRDWRVGRPAGRFLLALMSVKGNGTRTTVKRSKVTIGLLVGRRAPFAQGAFDRAQIVNIQRLNPPQCGGAVRINRPGNQVARHHMQGLHYFHTVNQAAVAIKKKATAFKAVAFSWKATPLGCLACCALNAAAPAHLVATDWLAPPWQYRPVAALGRATGWRFLRQNPHLECGYAKPTSFRKSFAGYSQLM